VESGEVGGEQSEQDGHEWRLENLCCIKSGMRGVDGCIAGVLHQVVASIERSEK